MHFGVQEKLWVKEPLAIQNWQGPLDQLRFPHSLAVRGAPMMKALSQGIGWVRNNLKIHSQLDLDVPGVMFTRGHDIPGMPPNPFAYNPETNNIQIDIDALLFNTRTFVANEIVSFHDPIADEVTFHGSIANFYRLNGGHETEHSRWDQFEGQPLSRSSRPEFMSRPEYDAQPHEFAAKRTERAIADHFGMPAETKAIIDRDIKDAEEYIRQREELTRQYWENHWTNWRSVRWVRGQWNYWTGGTDKEKR